MKTKHIISLVVLVAAVGYVLFLSFDDSFSYYLTVGEFHGNEAEYQDMNIRLAGKVVDSSIAWQPEQISLGFEVAEGGHTVSVSYNGTKPDGLAPGVDVLIEGRYSLEDREFHASNILLECPSKYELSD